MQCLRKNLSDLVICVTVIIPYAVWNVVRSVLIQLLISKNIPYASEIRVVLKIVRITDEININEYDWYWFEGVIWITSSEVNFMHIFIERTSPGMLHCPSVAKRLAVWTPRQKIIEVTMTISLPANRNVWLYHSRSKWLETILG